MRAWKGCPSAWMLDWDSTCAGGQQLSEVPVPWRVHTRACGPAAELSARGWVCAIPSLGQGTSLDTCHAGTLVRLPSPERRIG